MATSPSDIETIPGFMDWFLGEPDASRGAPAAVVEVHGIGCTFSRSLTEEERAEVLGLLVRHADAHKEHRLIGTLAVPLAEITAERIDEIRTVAREIELAGNHGGSYPDMKCMVGLAFGARRDAAEKKRATFGGEILEDDEKCALIASLVIPLSQHAGTVAEIQKYLAHERKRIGDVELDRPPVFLAELTMVFEERAAAEALRPRFDAIGLTTNVVERVGKSVFWEVLRWQERWLVKSGRVEELMRPRRLSTAGFLGETERLEEVLKEDASTLVSLGITAADVAGRIREIVGKALRSRSSRYSRQDTYDVGRFRVRLMQWGGSQECPWLCAIDSGWASIDFAIENRRTGAKLRGPGLIVHLIAEHGFFEGKESPYRVDPRQAAEVLGLPRKWWDRFWRLG
ncbi:hypothetical protein [Polyangium sp. y55x31]|uniref:hypothetical protein n=1 Tax=Polyangium sp. y55x31 TaxID=3042688 RepID=UPI0024832BDA|nr:hypothetical protein [Polyangium sp. y55x31]MDI1476833.1 hypothetical protein [Polyangium sp. y55x31]